LNSTSRGRPFSRPRAGAVGQLLVGFGSLLALLSPIWLPLAAAGALLMVVGVVVSAPEARRSGPYLEQWWTAMALASLVCLTGFGLELLLPVVGGVLLSAGGVAALLAVALGTPPRGAQLSG
jgi:hypothetical protein